MVTSFPFGNELIESAFLVFRGTTSSLIKLVPLIFLLRLIVIKITLGGVRDYGELLKELLFLYIGFFVFEEVMEMIMKAPEIAESVISKPVEQVIAISEGDKTWWEYYFNVSWPDVVKVISSVVYWVVCFFYLIIMSLMITVGAYIILFSTLFRMKWMFTAYMALVMILSMWPFIWYSIDQTFIYVIKNLKSSGSGTASTIAAIIGALLKLSVPIAGFKMAMSTPVSIAQGFKEKLSTGSKPIRGAMGYSAQTIQRAGSTIGLGEAVESFRSAPELREQKAQAIRKNRRFQVSSTMPAIAYGIKRASGSLQGRDIKGASLHSEKKVESFRDFKQRNELRYNQRRVTKINEKLNSQKTLSYKKRQKLQTSLEQSNRKIQSITSSVVNKSSITRFDSMSSIDKSSGTLRVKQFKVDRGASGKPFPNFDFSQESHQSFKKDFSRDNDSGAGSCKE